MKITAGNIRELEVRSGFDDFKAVETRAKSFYAGLTNTQKNTILNTLTNWTGATAGQKADALLACVALLFVAVGYLIRLQVKEV